MLKFHFGTAKLIIKTGALNAGTLGGKMPLLPEVSKHYGKLMFFINGQWVESRSGHTFEDRNPANDDVIAKVPVATTEEVQEAVAAAHEAFRKWRNVPFRDRAEFVFNLRNAFQTDFDFLARVLVQDHGRTMDESTGTIQRCIENVEAAGSSMYGVYKGEHVEQLATGIDCYRVREPVGVFLILTPGNIPMHAWSSFVPYAIACGCTVVVSPSWQNPVAADAVFKVTEKIGLPPGVVNMVHVGKDFALNRQMLEDPRVKGVGFIGSTAIGRQLFALCGSLGKRSSINGNGKNFIVILPDADVDQAVQYLLRGCFGMTGQRCLGSDNVAVIGGIYDELREKFIAASKAMKLGYGLDESVEMGPLTTRENKEKVERFIEQGLKEGAKLILDGRGVRVPGCEKGYFIGPTVFEGVTTTMHIAKEESFGPVANLIRARDLDEVIGWINAANYGHSACIVTRSGAAARRFARECEVGNIGVNAGIPQPYSFFGLGSKKESFFGNAKSRMDSVDMFLDAKTVTLRWV